MLEKAAGACAGAGQARQLATRLLNSGFDSDRVRAVYGALKPSMGDESDRLAWADGIVELFSDRSWAGRELDALAQTAQGEDLLNVRQLRRRRATV